jgi:DNA-binding NtrC family response regulator
MGSGELCDRRANIPLAVKPGRISADSVSDMEIPTVLTMDQMQYQHACRVLDEVRGNKLRSAKLLGISRMTLYRLLSRHAGYGASGATGAVTGSPAMTALPRLMQSAPQHASL